MEINNDNLKKIYLCLNTRCNYCRDTCGAFERYKMDFNSPRGKIELIHETLSNRVDAEKAAKIVYICMACKRCAKACPYGIDTSEILWNYRYLFKSHCIRKYLFMTAYFFRSLFERFKF